MSCVVLALIAIAAATFLLIRSEQQLRSQIAALRGFDQHARDASAALVDARVGQQAYVAAGQGAAFWIVKTAAAVQAATDELTALRRAAGAAALTALDEASATVVEFVSVDQRARDYLTSGQQLMAGDVIFSEGSEAAATAVRQIETARLAQHQAAEVETAAVRQRQTLAAGGAAGIAVLAMLLLLPVPRTRESGTTHLSIAASPAASQPAPSPPAPVRKAGLTSHAQGSVLKAATEIVTEFGRVRDLDDLTRLLGRAAEVMDASGLMVWMGSATGSDLRPVLAHGYSAAMIARIPPVPRSADNAAASAYRSGTLQIVLSHPGGSSGAVVAPILATDGCIGALSAEIRSGGETSESVQALAIIFAAQLAGVLAATPAAVPEAEIDEPRVAANS